MSSIAVILCTYDGARHIEEQLLSILRQTRLPDRLVIADDGSTDGTPALVDRLLEQHVGDLPVRIDRLPAGPTPLGPGANFARAAAVAREELIAFADQDDVWREDRLEVGHSALERDGRAQVFASDAALTDDRGAPLGRTVFESLHVRPEELAAFNGREAWRMLLRRNALPGMTLLVRRDFLLRSSPVPPDWIHDYYLVITAAVEGALHVSDEALVLYRQHSGNAIGIATPGGARRNRRPPLRIDPRRWSVFRDQVARGGADPVVLEALDEKFRFEILRQAVRSGSARRIPALLHRSVRGDYGRFQIAGLAQLPRDVAAGLRNAVPVST